MFKFICCKLKWPRFMLYILRSLLSWNYMYIFVRLSSQHLVPCTVTVAYSLLTKWARLKIQPLKKIVIRCLEPPSNFHTENSQLLFTSIATRLEFVWMSIKTLHNPMMISYKVYCVLSIVLKCFFITRK